MVGHVILALPAYNEAECIGALLQTADSVFKEMGLPAHMVVLDDGSSDDTVQVVESQILDTPVIVEKHPENRGLGEAIKSVLRASLKIADSSEDLIVCMDSDNTHPPDVIVHMLERLSQGDDIIIASRYRRGSRQIGVPLFRRLLSFGARWVFWWKLRLPGVRDYTCGFRGYRASVLKKAFDHYGDSIITREGFACTDELLVNLAHLQPKIGEIPFILRYDRKRGPSKIQLWKTIRETLKMLRSE